jgi:hypothetical protein
VSREHEVRLPDRFWRHSTHLSLDAKGLYSVLLTFINYQTCVTFVSNPRLQLETGYGVVKVKALLSELEKNGYIRRNQEMRGNLKSKRYIKCLKYASPVVQIPSNRSGSTVFGTTENQPTILTKSKSSVTKSKEEELRPCLTAPEISGESIGELTYDFD